MPVGSLYRFDVESYQAAARKTRTREFARLLDASEPLTGVHHTRSTRNIWRRFDRLGRVSRLGGADAGVNDGAGQENAAEVGQGVFVVAGRDAAPLLEPVEAALDGVA